MTMITMPHDGNRQFNLALVLRHLVQVGRPYIIQGQQQVILREHTKPNSLDYLLRENCAQLRDTAQATNAVIDEICNTGLFVRMENIVCPDSGRECQGISLVRDNP